LPGGKRGSKLAARADAELGEDLPQVVDDGGGAEEQLRGDLRVGGALAGEAGDQRFLRGKGIWRLDGVLPGVPAGRPQLDARPFGKRRGADRVEDRDVDKLLSDLQSPDVGASVPRDTS
jgi:hypothetical protein